MTYKLNEKLEFSEPYIVNENVCAIRLDANESFIDPGEELRELVEAGLAAPPAVAAAPVGEGEDDSAIGQLRPAVDRAAARRWLGEPAACADRVARHADQSPRHPQRHGDGQRRHQWVAIVLRGYDLHQRCRCDAHVPSAGRLPGQLLRGR